MLAALLWIIAVVVAALLLIWVLAIGVMVVGGIVSTELCPRCGVSLGITDRDRFLAEHLDPRYGRGRYDYCSACGWRRSED